MLRGLGAVPLCNTMLFRHANDGILCPDGAAHPTCARLQDYKPRSEQRRKGVGLDKIGIDISHQNGLDDGLDLTRGRPAPSQAKVVLRQAVAGVTLAGVRPRRFENNTSI